MSKGTRSSTVERTEVAPLVSSRRGKFIRLENLELEAEASAKLTKYKQYVREVEGEEPTDGAICSAALEMLFAADAGFMQSLDGQRRAGRNAAVRQNGAAAANAAGMSANGSGVSTDKRKKADEQTSVAG